MIVIQLYCIKWEDTRGHIPCVMITMTDRSSLCGCGHPDHTLLISRRLTHQHYVRSASQQHNHSQSSVSPIDILLLFNMFDQKLNSACLSVAFHFIINFKINVWKIPLCHARSIIIYKRVCFSVEIVDYDGSRGLWKVGTGTMIQLETTMTSDIVPWCQTLLGIHVGGIFIDFIVQWTFILLTLYPNISKYLFYSRYYKWWIVSNSATFMSNSLKLVKGESRAPTIW